MCKHRYIIELKVEKNVNQRTSDDIDTSSKEGFSVSDSPGGIIEMNPLTQER